MPRRPPAPYRDAAQTIELGIDVARQLMTTDDWEVLIDRALTQMERKPTDAAPSGEDPKP